MKNKVAFLAAFQLAVRIGIAPISMFLIVSRYSLEFQGMYYLLSSLVSTVTLVEAGASYLIIRNIVANNSQYNSEYVASYRRYIQIVSYILFVIIILYWKYFLHLNSNHIQVMLLAIVVAFGLNIQKDLSVYEALNPYEYHKSKAKATTLLSFVLLASLYFRFGLWSIVFSQAAMHVYLYLNKMPLEKITARSKFEKVFRKDWQLNITWITGYFFWTFGIMLYAKFMTIEDAGRFGLMHSVFYAILMLSQSYLQGNRAQIVEDVRENSMTFSSVIKLLAITLLGYLILSGAFIFVISANLFDLKNRLFDLETVVLYSIYFILVLFVNAMASIARSFGGEPFYKVLIIQNILMPITIVFGLLKLGVYLTIFYQLLLMMIFGLFGMLVLRKVINENS